MERPGCAICMEGRGGCALAFFMKAVKDINSMEAFNKAYGRLYGSSCGGFKSSKFCGLLKLRCFRQLHDNKVLVFSLDCSSARVSLGRVSRRRKRPTEAVRAWPFSLFGSFL